MQLLFYFVAIGAVVSQIAMHHSVVTRVDHPASLQQAQTELAKYRMFSYAANQYVAAHAYATAGIETITWAQIRVADTTPPGAQAVDVPSTWMVRRDASRWALCAALDESTVAMMQQLLPKEKQIVMRGSALSVSLSNQLVLGETSTSEATAYGTLCL